MAQTTVAGSCTSASERCYAMKTTAFMDGRDSDLSRPQSGSRIRNWITRETVVKAVSVLVEALESRLGESLPPDVLSG